LVVRAVADRKLTQLDAFLGFVLRSFGKAVATYLERVDHAPP
jgi:hypothetical protein